MSTLYSPIDFKNIQSGVGLGSILSSSTRFLVENKKGIMVVTVSALETTNGLINGDIILPDAPFSIDTIKNNESLPKLQETQTKVSPKPGIKMEKLIAKPKVESKPPLIEISFNNSKVCNLTNLITGENLVIDTAKEDPNVYHARLADGQIYQQIRPEGMTIEDRMDSFKNYYENIKLNRILTDELMFQ